MHEIRVLLLGRPEVTWRGEIIQIQSPASRLLLFFLAWRGALVERENILAFFADESEEIAHKRLREAIEDLQQIFPNVNLLISKRQMLGLDFDLIDVDQLEFQELVDRAGRTPWGCLAETSLSDEAQQYFHQAEALWHGKHFLENENFYEFPKAKQWLEDAQHSVERLYQHILERLAGHAFSNRNFEQSFHYSQKALVYDELNEQLHYQALRSLEMIGDYDEMKRYLEALHSRFGFYKIGHSARLIRIQKQLIKNRIALSQADSQSPWNLHQNPEMRFTGRLAEIWQLFQCLERGGAVCVVGEAGMGRTRLLQEFVQLIDTRTRVLAVTCMPGQSILPFQPFIDLLRNQIQTDEWQTLEAKWTGQLSLLLPELADIQPRLSLPEFHYDSGQEINEARILILEAIRNLFLSLSHKHRLLVCMDDIHLADDATISAIDYLLSRPPFDENALLVVTLRSDEENPRLEKWLESIKTRGTVQIIYLGSLQSRQIASLAYGISRKVFPETFINKLTEETHGNPLFIIETMISFIEQNPDAELSDSQQFPVAHSLHLAIQERLQKLESPVRHLLEAAAVIGMEFESDILAEVGRLPGPDTRRGLEKLEKRMLVEKHPSPEQVIYRFRHTVIREEILAQIPPLHAQWYHGQVARYLQEKCRSNEKIQPAVIAFHFEEANDLPLAYDYWLQAGQRARSLLSTQEAWDAFWRAEKLISKLPGLDEQKIYRLFSEMLELAFWQENCEEMERLNSTLYRLGQERNSSLLKGTALNSIGNTHFGSYRYEEGLHLIEQAIPLLEESGSLYEQSLAHNRRGAFLYLLNRMEDSAAALQDSLILSAESQEPRMIQASAFARTQIATERILSGWPRTALTHAQHALDSFNRLGQLHGQVLAMSQCTLAYYYLGDLQQAARIGAQAIELGSNIQTGRIHGNMKTVMALTEMAFGNFDEAWRLAEYAVSLGESHGYNEITAAGRNVMGDIFFYLGDLTGALNNYQRGHAAIGDAYIITDCLSRLGHVLFRIGLTETSEKMLQDGILTYRQNGLGLGWVQAKMAQTAMYFQRKEYQKAKDTGNAVMSEIRRREMSDFYRKHRLLMASIALQMGDYNRGVRVYKDAAQEAKSAKNALFEMMALRVLIRLFHGQEEEKELQMRARALLEDMDSHAQHPAIRQAFLGYRQNIMHVLG